MHQIDVNGITVDIVRKEIKNLHLGVYPPDGKVRVAAPLAVNDEAIRYAVIGKMGWIKQQQAKFTNQPRQSPREMVSGESHYFLGQRYRLDVIECPGPIKVICNKSVIKLHIPPQSNAEQRELVLQQWYRKEIKSLIPPMLDKWQPLLNVEAAEWGVKKMKTKWGSCNTSERRIWINLELIKKPIQCLEYIVVHELVHLLEKHHNARFKAFMDNFMPHWRLHREELGREPLGHDRWNY
ncbi:MULTISPECIES: M48 family metallopeptidase [Parachlamydia]|uniref:M48 family metallopeptidase n=1 Tax=Parachlamydia TaxID=83551 RepID=UPI0007513A7D|nr:SprT family zinc-dependent metalloprotease [Parachlamydia acanthamoebae]